MEWYGDSAPTDGAGLFVTLVGGAWAAKSAMVARAACIERSNSGLPQKRYFAQNDARVLSLRPVSSANDASGLLKLCERPTASSRGDWAKKAFLRNDQS